MPKKNNSKRLKFIAISGTTGATENLYIYEYENDIVVVDCGVGFPDAEMYGVDLVIPDFTYLRQNKKKIRGIVVTHGHEDHLGAIPFLFKDGIKAPVYATKLTMGFIKDKLADHGLKAELKEFDPDKDDLTLGVFKVTPFRVSHSVPDGVGLAIDTPEGVCFHVPDYKFDWTSVDKKPFDMRKAAMLASNGVLALASDALGATTPGHTESEMVLEERIENIVSKSNGRVFFTTISSNISRMQQALNVAQRHGRQVVFVGRSIDAKSDIAKKLGFLHYPNSLVISPHQAKNRKKDQLMYIISGCYGQPGSALYRATIGDHRFLQIDSSDTVIFSADPAPPGSKIHVDYLVDRLFEMEVNVHYYELQENLHVSGHGSQEDIKFLLGLIKPKYYIPIGGTIRHMKAYADIAENMGADRNQILQLTPGSVVEFKDGRAKRLKKKVPSKEVLVDGLGVGDVGNIVLRDRQRLASDGFVIAVIQIDRDTKKLSDQPEIISRGFVFEKSQKNILIDASKRVDDVLSRKNSLKARTAKQTVIDELEKFFFKEIKRRPMILPVVIEI